MIVLGIDTATPLTAAALLDTKAGLELEAHHQPQEGERPGHTTELLALVYQLFHQAKFGWEHVERIAVGVGPGMFTGMRVGIATARAFAQSRQIDLVGVSTLQALANGAYDQLQSPEKLAIVTVLPAGKGEVFAAAFQGKQIILGPSAYEPAALSKQLGDMKALAIGNGALQLLEAQSEHKIEVPPANSPLHRLDARYICRIGSAEDRQIDGSRVLPTYLRPANAKPLPKKSKDLRQ